MAREHLDTVGGAFRASASTRVIDAESRTTETADIAGEAVDRIVNPANMVGMF
jgi:hypothetical protein